MVQKPAANSAQQELKQLLMSIRGPIMSVGLFSFFVNLMMLVVPIYMMQLFDRVLSSRSESTLIALTVITLGLLLIMGILDSIRHIVLSRLGGHIDSVLSPKAFSALFKLNLKRPASVQGLGDIDAIRQFFSGSGMVSFLDVPFIPIFLLAIFLLHPMLGIIALCGTIVVLGMGLYNELKSRPQMLSGGEEMRKATYFAETSLRNAEALSAMGMFEGIRKRWALHRDQSLDDFTLASEKMGRVNAMVKTSSFIMQVVMLGAACYLALQHTVTPGVMFAANILMMRMIAPIQMVIGGWRGFATARESYQHLQELLSHNEEDESKITRLPRPVGALQLEGVVAAPPAAERHTIRNVSFELEPGDGLGVIGPSGAGKSTLARLLVGVWKPLAGHVRLDGADVYNWDHRDLGQYLGYLPQDIELFDGTIADNIARFGERDDEAIVRAAKKAGVHERILQQPQGYDTEIRSQGGILSGGQRQWIGLARALYNDPAFIVLDEPNSNLDQQGEQALAAALAHLRQEGVTVVVIAHNPRTIQSMNKLLYLKAGQAVAFGLKEQVLPTLTQPVKQGEEAANTNVTSMRSMAPAV